MLIWTDRGYKTVGGEVSWPVAPAAVVKSTMTWIRARNESIERHNASMELRARRLKTTHVPVPYLPIPDFCR